jgi:DNA repair protein RecO (recombination protein O)
MLYVESDAIVLRHVKQGDSSRVITLFARDTGKVAVLAKGIRSQAAKYGSSLDLFNVARIQYRPRSNRDLVYLHACDLRRSFEPVTRDVFGYAAAAVCVELLDRLVPEGALSPDLFDLLLEALEILAETVPLPEGEEMRAVAFPVSYQMKFMDRLGLAPELSACVGCGEPELRAASLFPRRGGLLCRRCRSSEGGRHLGRASIEFLQRSRTGDLGAVMTSATSPTKGTVLESRAALDSVLEYHHHVKTLGLRSRKFLDGLWRTG